MLTSASRSQTALSGEDIRLIRAKRVSAVCGFALIDGC